MASLSWLRSAKNYGKEAAGYIGSLPNRTADMASDYKHGGVIRDSIVDKAREYRGSARSVGNSILDSGMRKADQSIRSGLNGMSADQADQIWRSGVSSATAGALTGAAGGMLSEDQSVLGGALMGGALGAVGGVGLSSTRLASSINNNNRIDKLTNKLSSSNERLNSRIRDLRTSRPVDKADPKAFQDRQSANAGLGVRGMTGTRAERIQADRARMGNVKEDIQLRKRLRSNDAKRDSLNKRKTQVDGSLSTKMTWGIGAGAGALTLAHSTLDANRPLGY
ncbi:MAG: hypothetical protein PHY47_00480 [Lachnospiraceae bacterium]|nr:hypothetical protein [Lachnospiraceae bacterium]